MVIVWRGIGIAVPIVLVIVGIINSYFFEDARFGNGYYMGWNMFWSSLVLGLVALGIKGGESEERELEPGEIYQPAKHDFFWIPVWVWAAVFFGWGLYLVFTATDTSENTYDYDYSETISGIPEGVSNERKINFWNPQEDSVTVNTTYAEDGSHRMTETIKSGNVIYGDYYADKYRVEYLGKQKKITVHGTEADGDHIYNDGWCILGKGIDFYVLETTTACSDTINRGEIRAIDWMPLIKGDRYDGSKLVEFDLRLKDKSKTLDVYGPGFTLPVEHDANTIIYSIIPIQSELELTEEYLDSMVIDVCY